MPNELFMKSVTEGDLGKVSNGAVLQIIVPFYQGSDRVPLPPQLPPYWSYQRDMTLRSTIYHEAMWAASVSIAICKVSSMSWVFEGKTSAKKLKQAQELLLFADGQQVGWMGFIQKHLRDYLTTDNGGFIEIVRAHKGAGSRIVGIRHLDAIRCQRTGDPDIPVIYRDKMGRMHEMKDYQVMLFSDMPDPSETYYGVGVCAATRSYYQIYKLSVIENYLREKVSGIRPLAIYIVNGVLDQQLQGAVQTAKTEEQARGMVSYMGAIVIGIPNDIQPQLVTIPLAELPDRFNRKEEFDISVLTYADNLGLDPQDLQPLGGRSMSGAGAQSEILQDKAKGKGLVSWKQDWVHHVNTYILPEAVIRFRFTERDYRDLAQQSGIQLQHAQIAAARISAGITNADQELQVMVTNDELPTDFLKAKTISDETYEDTDNISRDDIKTENQQAADQPKLADGAVQALQPGQLVDPNGAQTGNNAQPGTTSPEDMIHSNQPGGSNSGTKPIMIPFKGNAAKPAPRHKIWGLPRHTTPQELKPPQRSWGMKEAGDHKEEEPVTEGEESPVPMDAATRRLDPRVLKIASTLYRRATMTHKAVEEVEAEKVT